MSARWFGLAGRAGWSFHTARADPLATLGVRKPDTSARPARRSSIDQSDGKRRCVIVHEASVLQYRKPERAARAARMASKRPQQAVHNGAFDSLANPLGKATAIARRDE
jgi:hypothetical protein